VIISIFAAMIDFVYQLILGFDYPGLTKALDPVTIALLVGQGVQQVGKIKEANQAEKRAAKQQQKGKDLYDKMLSDFQSGEYDLSLSQDVRDSAEQQRMLAEQFSDAATQSGQAQLQSSLAAARYGDPRAAALIPKQAQQIEQGVQQAQLQGLQQRRNQMLDLLVCSKILMLKTNACYRSWALCNSREVLLIWMQEPLLKPRLNKQGLRHKRPWLRQPLRLRFHL